MQTYEVKCPSGAIISIEIDRSDPNSIRVNVVDFNSMIIEDRVFMLVWCAKMLPLADPTAKIVFTKDGLDPLVMKPFPVSVDEIIEDNNQKCYCERCVMVRKMAEKAHLN